jgi:hypothetical protein
MFVSLLADDVYPYRDICARARMRESLRREVSMAMAIRLLEADRVLLRTGGYSVRA